MKNWDGDGGRRTEMVFRQINERARTRDAPNSHDFPEEQSMATSITHETAKTEYVEADGVRFAYRRFGRPGGTPVVFCHRFRGTMDDWDPAVINGVAREREVIRCRSLERADT
jgi:hypothetical protein